MTKFYRTVVWCAALAMAVPVVAGENDETAVTDDGENAQKPDPNEIVCEYRRPTGSRIREKICRTRAQAEEEARLNRHMLERGSGSVGRTMASPNG